MSSTLDWPPQGRVAPLGPQSPSPLSGPSGGFVSADRYYRDVVPRLVKVAAPAAGAEWSVACEGGRTWHVQAIRFQLVTSVVAGNRFLTIGVGDGTDTYYETAGLVAQVANATTRYSFVRDAGFGVSANGSPVLMNFWPRLPVLGGQTISSLTAAIDVGDQYSKISVYVYEVTFVPLPDGAAYPDDAETWRRQYHAPLLEEIV